MNQGSNASIVGVYKVERDELLEYPMACTQYLFSSGCRGWSSIVICHLVIAVNPGCMHDTWSRFALVTSGPRALLS